MASIELSLNLALDSAMQGPIVVPPSPDDAPLPDSTTPSNLSVSLTALAPPRWAPSPLDFRRGPT